MSTHFSDVFYRRSNLNSFC